jgi:hypothetical protein
MPSTGSGTAYSSTPERIGDFLCYLVFFLFFLKRLESEIEGEIEKLESLTGESTPLMRLLIIRLSVKHL